MPTAAIICEYNPFHAGHARHITQTRERGADRVICVMSGPFTQRGEAAVADKFTRARQALLSGADVVVELPFLFAAQSAEGFARGAARIASSLGADILSFGAEGDLALLEKAARAVSGETGEMSKALRESQKKGESNARARQRALETVDPRLGELLEGPNNILAIEYLRAIDAIGGMRPIAIPREYPRPGSREERDALPSSSCVRRALREAGSDTERLRILEESGCPAPFSPLFAEEKLFELALYEIRMSRGLEEIAGVNRAVGSRLKKAARKARSYDELLAMTAARSLPLARVRRCLILLLLRSTKSDLETANALCSPLHARLLGFRSQSRKFLGRMISESEVPVVTRFREYPDTVLARADLRAADLYALLSDPPRSGDAEKSAPPVIV